MFDKLTLKLSDEDKAHKEAIKLKLKERYRNYRDPWGFNLESVFTALDLVYPVYKNYFKVRVFGEENIQNTPYILTSNHSGQLMPLDGVMITTAFATEIDPPRVLHSMVDHFLAGFPFLGDLTAQTGSILGDRGNCTWLLDQGESVLVFPEGMNGITKNTNEFYQMRPFTNGFFRMALYRGTPILPMCVVGAEEMYPFVYNAKKLGRSLGLPTIPLMTNYLPLPSPLDIYIGAPYEVPKDLSPDAPDKEIQVHVQKIQKQIEVMLKAGLEKRRPFFDQVRKPIQELLFKTKLI
jgi:1-acyl-sn-glycerol-3-phosphate acyltransferase